MTDQPGFLVRLDNFEGPFDLLLQLIAKHQLDVTEVALSRVTDEFIAHIRARGSEWDLELTSSFLVIAATLLDLKATRLLGSGDVEDEEDLALLEARDLLFARLLQYRAFKQVSHWLADRLAAQADRAPRPGGMEPQLASALPELIFRATPEDLARLAAQALTPREAVAVSLAHLHDPAISVAEEGRIVLIRLRTQQRVTFADLVADAPSRLATVCRFLALLELYRDRAVQFSQTEPLGPLIVDWVGSADHELVVVEEYAGERHAG